MKYLVNSLILCLLAVSCASISGVKRTANAVSSNLPVWDDGLKTDTLKNTLRVDIQVKDNSFSGLCILKRADGALKGTVINEFGTKAFDFAVTAEKCELKNVIQMLDKQYIKTTIESDLYFLFESDNDKVPFFQKEERFEQNNTLIVNYKKKQIEKEPNGAITLKNLKYGIIYRFRKITEIDRNKLII